MKLLGGKKSKDNGRQRRTSDWQRPSSFSYHAQRAERADAAGGRQQPSLATKRSRLLSLQFWAKRSGLLIAVLVALVCAVSILSLSNSPRIVLLDAQNNRYAFHDASEYQAAAAQNLSSSIWNKNKITVNTGSASAQMQKQFPELAEVSITLPLVGHRPIYYLRANAPAFVLQTVNGTFVLDVGGKALITKAAAPAATVAKLPVIADQTGLHAEVGKQVMSSRETTFIRIVIDTLAARAVTVSSLSLPANAAQELDVRIAGKPYLVKFNMHDTTTARQQVGTYLATASNLAGQNITPAQYIDVRVLGRSYYL
ncbi:MAG: hypothetical protein JWN82_271 [Candidatus Saccharibacteria bacterium]|nr:hypothetical protein [Candidatus Saccharibacteria bacterium]